MAITYLIVGYVGMVLLLSAFILNAMQKISSSSKTYAILNAAASLLLLAYSFSLASIPFAIVNLVWLVFSLADLLKRS